MQNQKIKLVKIEVKNSYIYKNNVSNHTNGEYQNNNNSYFYLAYKSADRKSNVREYFAS